MRIKYWADCQSHTKSMRKLVLGDIHGNYRALQQCLERAKFDFISDQLIQLGDVADGYDDVYRCVELLLKVEKLIPIRGNHDLWFAEFIKTGVHPCNWEQSGTFTAYSYLKAAGRAEPYHVSDLTPEDIPETHRNFFLNQRFYHIDEQNNCFVHAGFDRTIPFEDQSPETYCWDRSLWKQALASHASNKRNQSENQFKMVTQFREVFMGHTPTINWKTDKPMRAANIYNIDTGCGHGYRLTIMDVSTKEYWQSDLQTS